MNKAVEVRQVSTSSARIVIPGGNSLNFADYTTLSTERPVHRVGQPPELLARFEWPSSSETKQAINAVSGEPQEWAGLLTFAFNRRIEALEEMALGVEGSMYGLLLPLSDRIDSNLMAPIENGQDSTRRFSGALEKLLSLPDSDYDIISAAIQMHYSAALLSVRETNAAYSLLVGAIELLAQRYGEMDNSWEAWSEAAKWDARFRKLKLNEDQRKGMRKELLSENKHRNLKRSFVAYVQERIPLDFWSSPVRDWFHQFDTASGECSGGDWAGPRPRLIESPSVSFVDKVLSGAYLTRSEYVHAGKRHINLADEMTIIARPEKAKRLPIAALRDALRVLIEQELEKRARQFVLPSVQRTTLWTPDDGSFI
ncbi:hypothetical protein [Amycolatopsis sp. cmx-11-12]|uniref:hypothetical protein n=1 Tax=Amycolatopsis sp. cmx-11-12 TaxID=2785795 RepID=UPI0039182B11